MDQINDLKEYEEYMRLAVAKAQEGIIKGQTPFGACIVREGKVLSCAHNTVWEETDITAHAEICAIREACQSVQSAHLEGSVIFSTCEPCPMCFSACHWARIGTIVYGARIADAKAAGFHSIGKYKENFQFSLLLGKFSSSLESGNFPRL